MITIWVFLITKSEFYLGMFNLFLSGFSFVFYFIATTFIKPSKRKQAILLGSTILYFALFIILFDINFTLLIIYAIIVGIAHPIINVPYVSLTYDVIGKAWQAKNLRIEYIVVRELFVNIGRVISIVAFIIGITIFPTEQIIPLLLVIFGAGQLLIYIAVKDIHIVVPEEKGVMIKDQMSDEKNR